MSKGPPITRLRHELRRRNLTVTSVERLPASMVRIKLQGAELEGFTSPGFDDHIKLFFPDASGVVMRDFTPRRFDPTNRALWIDFFLHEGGPAAQWASRAAVGQSLEIGGPRGSAVIAIEDIETCLMVGDETALPAIGRRLEQLTAAHRAWVVVEIDPRAGTPEVSSRARVDVAWVPRGPADTTQGTGPAHDLIDALQRLKLPPDRCFAWVATESKAARAIRTYLRAERGFDKDWIKAAGYWQRGKSGAHDTIADDA